MTRACPASALRSGPVLLLLLATAVTTAQEASFRLLEYVRTEFGQEACQRLTDWQQLQRLPAGASPLPRLRLVNSFFNRVHFVTDMQHWGEEDYWATPVELLATNGGDCEDFSIAKYLTLKAMGVPDEQLRIVYVKAEKLNQAHMVLTWYPEPDADPLILDNLINEILPASARTDLEPVYSFNGDGLWLNHASGQQQKIGEARKLSRWQELRQRLTEPLPQ